MLVLLGRSRKHPSVRGPLERAVGVLKTVPSVRGPNEGQRPGGMGRERGCVLGPLWERDVRLVRLVGPPVRLCG